MTDATHPLEAPENLEALKKEWRCAPVWRLVCYCMCTQPRRNTSPCTFTEERYASQATDKSCMST